MYSSSKIKKKHIMANNVMSIWRLKVSSYDVAGIHFGDYPKSTSFGKDSPSEPLVKSVSRCAPVTLHFAAVGTPGTPI